MHQMALSAPSIQSFFQREVPSIKTNKPAVPIDLETGDGFTSSEIEATLHPTLHIWQPRCEYREVEINDLTPGPGCVTVQGRIVNLFEQPFTGKMPQAAKGCLHVIVKDDTGAFRVMSSKPSGDATYSKAFSRSNSTTPKSTTACALATSSPFGRHTSQMPILPPSLCKRLHLLPQFSRRGIIRAILEFKKKAMRTFCTGLRLNTEVGSSWLD